MEHPEEECHTVGEHHCKHDDDENVSRTEYKRSIDMKIVLRQSNLNPKRPDSGFLRTLDSSIRRNTAVIKKLKQINDEQREGLIEELRSVNLSKFVSEAVAAICDAKLKTSDIQAAVQTLSLKLLERNIKIEVNYKRWQRYGLKTKAAQFLEDKKMLMSTMNSAAVNCFLE